MGKAGNRIKTTPESVKRMAEEGHEIGYHTWSHTFFFNMTKKQIEDDLNTFQQKLMEVCGQKATVYRAPGGNITNTALSTIPMPHIMWSVDTRDWETRNTTAVKNAIIGGLKDGAIILVHDIHATTYYGTKEAIEAVKAMMVNGEWDVFSGVKLQIAADGTITKVDAPLMDNAGNEIVAAGGPSVEDGVITGTMNYFVAGVEEA